MIEKINFTYNDSIKVINKDQFEAHMRLYEGYVTSINKIDAQFQAGNDSRNQANLAGGFCSDCKGKQGLGSTVI